MNGVIYSATISQPVLSTYSINPFQKNFNPIPALPKPIRVMYPPELTSNKNNISAQIVDEIAYNNTVDDIKDQFNQRVYEPQQIGEANNSSRGYTGVITNGVKKRFEESQQHKPVSKHYNQVHTNPLGVALGMMFNRSKLTERTPPPKATGPSSIIDSGIDIGSVRGTILNAEIKNDDLMKGVYLDTKVAREFYDKYNKQQLAQSYYDSQGNDKRYNVEQLKRKKKPELIDLLIKMSPKHLYTISQ